MSFSKDELMPLHGLLYQTTKYFNEEYDIDLDQKYSKYNELGIRPHYAHKSKSEHEEAIQILSTIITESLSDEAQKSESRIILEDKT